MAAAASVAILGLGGYFAAGRMRKSAAAPQPRAELPTGDSIPANAKQILESIKEPLLLLESASRVVFANRASRTIHPDAAGKPIVSVLRTPGLLHAVNSAQQTRQPQTVAFTIPVPVQRHLQAHIAPATDQLMVVHIRDVSDIRRADELRADFVANASHELRTPLAALTGFIDTLRGHAKDDPEARAQFLEIMSAEAGRMRRLIDDLLSLTKIELNEHNLP